MDNDTKRQKASNVFSYALAAIFLCLDLLSIVHLGIKESKHRLISSHGQKKVYYKGLLFVFLRPCLIIFAATLGLWDTNPMELTIIGFFCVLAQLTLRKIGSKYMTHKQCALLDPAFQSTRRQSTVLVCTKAECARVLKGLPPLKEEDSSDSP